MRDVWVLFIGLASHRLVRGDDNVSDISRLQLAAAVEKAAQAQAAQIIERMNAKMLEMESKMAQRAAAQAAEAMELKKQLAAQATELGQLKATGREIDDAPRQLIVMPLSRAPKIRICPSLVGGAPTFAVATGVVAA